MTSIKAVLTADIVNSSTLSEKGLNDLLFAVKTELKWQKTKNDFYRGDSFHALCEVDQALPLALRLRTIALQAVGQHQDQNIDIRIAIGIGSVDEPVKTMASAKGEAFMLSGRELDVIDKTNARLAIRCTDRKLDAGLQAVALLADMVMQKMSSKQAEAVGELLAGATQMEIARKLNKSQPTVNRLAQSANWGDLEKAIEIYRKLVSLINE